MSVKRICDICGQEINIGAKHYTFQGHGLLESQYDICRFCFFRFKDWVAEEKKGQNNGSDSNQSSGECG